MERSKSYEEGRQQDCNASPLQHSELRKNLFLQLGEAGADNLPRNAAIDFEHFMPKRKKPLQRQMSTERLDMDDEAFEEMTTAQSPGEVRPSTNTAARLAAHHKRLQFQQQRPQSKLALQFSKSSQNTSSITSPRSLPAHSLSHHAVRSSSTSSATSLESPFKHQDSFESNASQPLDTPHSRCQAFPVLKRDSSMQSDSSRYSSVDSLLEARKPDPEAILINLGFGPITSEDILSRIPARFLKPSQVRGINTDAFVKRLQLASLLADHSVLGYRGLTGNPDMPPSSIVAKIMQRFEVNERKKSMGSLEFAI